MKWADLSTRRLANVSRDTICLLPLGATEQHGPHLPVATDQIIADSIAERLDDACEGKLLVMPGLPATYSDHHMAFPGTLTLNHSTLMRVVMEIIRSAVHHGFHRFFLLNAHGGNMAIGGVIAEHAAARLPQAEVVFSTWFRAASERLRPLVAGAYPAVGHACEFETSLMLALRPELVDRAAIADGGITPPSSLLQSDLLSGGPTVRVLPFVCITENGVWGKPSLATAEKGEAILDIVVSTIKQLLHAHWPEAPGVNFSEKNTGERTAPA